MPNGEPTRLECDELLEELHLAEQVVIKETLERWARTEETIRCSGLAYKVLRDMLIGDELDIKAYKQFTKRFEAELAKKGPNEKTYVY